MTEVWKPLLRTFVSSQTDQAEVLTPFLGKEGRKDKRVFKFHVANPHIEFRYANGLLWASKQHPLAFPGWSTGGPQNYNPDLA